MIQLFRDNQVLFCLTELDCVAEVYNLQALDLSDVLIELKQNVFSPQITVIVPLFVHLNKELAEKMHELC